VTPDVLEMFKVKGHRHRTT